TSGTSTSGCPPVSCAQAGIGSSSAARAAGRKRDERLRRAGARGGWPGGMACLSHRPLLTATAAFSWRGAPVASPTRSSGESMKITFRDGPGAAGHRLVARIVVQDKLPADLERVLGEGARAARFTGKAGQVFEGFVERDGEVVRMALVGAGPGGDERLTSLERAGAALAAKYLTSGVDELAIDAAGLDAHDLAAVLLGIEL